MKTVSLPTRGWRKVSKAHLRKRPGVALRREARRTFDTRDCCRGDLRNAQIFVEVLRTVSDETAPHENILLTTTFATSRFLGNAATQNRK